VSTYIYLQCLDHDPPLRAEDESGQHLYDLDEIRRDIADRETMIRYYRTGTSFAYFQQHTARFLAQHEKCRIGIADEYGVEYPLEEER
jgi:hypothetical protein